MIRVEGISHHFGSMQVLHDVWFHVPEGEVFGFIGPNGAGKTTTLRMMATLLEPAQGRILVGGYDVVERPVDVRRILGFMPDGFGVYERVTVWEYLEFFAACYGLHGQKRRKVVGDVLDLTDLGYKAKAEVNGLSRGMQQRLSVARVLLHDPKVLLMDEPASGLDPRARIEIRELLKELRRMGKTIIISSHILHELAELCNAVAIVEKGQLLFNGSVAEIMRRAGTGRVVHVRVEGLQVRHPVVPG